MHFLAVGLCHYATSQHSNTPLRTSQESQGRVVAVFWPLTISVSVSQKLVIRGPSFWLYHFLTLLKIQASEVGLDDSKGTEKKKKKKVA